MTLEDLRIGIDATALPPRPFGAANYIIHLIHALPQVAPTHAYIVFAKPEHVSWFAGRSGLRVVNARLPARLLRIVWEQTVLPWLVHQERLDLLHSPHYTMPFAVRCPTVVTFHDMTFLLYPEAHLLYKRLFFRGIMPLAARRADALIAISESTRADILRLLKPAAEKVFAVPYGVAPLFRPVKDCAAIEAICNRYSLPRQFILYVGNLEPRKNLPVLLQAFARLTQRGLPHALVLAGSRGWKDAEIFSTMKELGLASRVCFPGYIPQPDLPALYSAADLFVYPSLYEGFGLPVLEALACGIPVITSNVSSMPEVAGDAGILVNPRRVDELADALWRILTDRELHDELARKGVERAQMFSWTRTARETLAVYEQVVCH